MNYSGKFDATIPLGDLGPASHSYVHVASPASHAPADAIIVPDAQLLFSADFRRSGADLVLSKDEREFVLHDYFKGEKRAPLASPDGAHLTGDLVDALSGHVELSQAGAGPATVGHVIGHVTKLVGSATVVRNGVSIILTMGENVEKGDVVQCGSNSSLGITFIDGTVFGLLSNARMVLNEMVYDPNGSSNSSLMSLVAGTISFVAGETAKHGDMKIDTPVATMGIRGTACLVEIDFNVPAQNATPNASFQVLVEPDGTTGSYILYDKTTLQPLAVVNQAGQQLNINNGVISTSQNPLSPDIQKLIQDVFTQKFTENTQTKTTTAQTDTINPLLIGTPVRLANGSSATPIFAIKGDAGTGGTTQSLDQLLNGLFHIAGPPTLTILDTQGVETTSFSVVRQIVTTGNTFGMDSTGGTVVFQDINRGDSPSVSATFTSFKLLNANGQDVSTSLSAAQLAGIKAAEVDLALSPNAGNSNNGQTTWAYNIHDGALSFLAPGEKLTLTYDVTVSNNYALLPQSTTKQITITIVGGNPVQQWIHTANDGHDNLWTTPQNWASGIVPTTASDVIIVTDQLHSLLPAYPVTIENTNAVARSVTLNDLTPSSNDRPELDVESLSTLTIGTTLSLGSDSILRNWGTISVGGKVELLDQVGPPVLLNQSVIFNAGTMNLGQGGDIQGLAGITNTGTIDLKGGTLTVLVDIANSDGESSGQITVGAGATLALGTDPNGDSETTGGITGGRVTVNGVLELQGGNFLSFGTLVNNKQINVTGAGNALNGETVTNAGLIDVRAGGALTVDPTTINNANGTVAVDAGGKLALNAVTIDGGTVTNNGEVDLAGGGVLENGSLGNSAKILVSGAGNALHSENVTANNALELQTSADLVIDQGTKFGNSGGTITIDAGATLSANDAGFTGGTIANKSAGSIELTGSSTINNGALGNAGQITVTGASNALQNETVTANNVLEVLAGGGLMIQGSTVANTSGAVTVDESASLTVNATTVSGGSVTNKVNGTTAFTGSTSLQNGALNNSGQVNVSGTGNTWDAEIVANLSAAIAVTGALTLEHGTSITDGALTNSGDVFVETSSGATLDNVHVDNMGGTIQVEGASPSLATLIVDDGTTVANGTLTIGSLGSLEVASAAGATLTSVLVGNSGKIVVDAGSGLTLNGTTVAGGNLSNAGTILVESLASSTFDGVAIDNTKGTIQVDTNVTTTLILDDGTTISNGIVKIGSVGILEIASPIGATLSGLVVDNYNLIQVDPGSALNLKNVTINGGTLGGPGTIETADGNTDSTLNGVTLNAGARVTAAFGELDLTGTITNNGELDASGAGKLDLENVGLTGGTLGGKGTIGTATGNVDSALKNVTIAAGATVTAAVGELDLIGSITNNGELDASGNGKLDLEGVTIAGGTLGGKGTIATVSGWNTLSGTTIAGGATVKVTDNTVLELEGTIANLGTIALTSSGHSTELEISGSVLLGGGGQVTLTDDINNAVVSDGSPATLRNFDTITGAGTIGDSCLTLVNSGTINATGSHALTIDTGNHVVTNNAGGVLEASAGHKLQIDGDVLNNGLIEAGNPGGNSAALVNVTGSITGTGSIEIFNNAKLEIGCSVSSGQTVTFGTPGGPVATAAMLILDDSHHFYGTIVGLTENSNESLENVVDLKDLAYRAHCMSAHYSNGVVTVSNGIDCVTLKVSGNASNSFELASDGTGGTLLDDPPATGTVTIDSGKTLDISDASTATVTFANSAGSTGELLLDNSKAFTGQIVGFAGDGTTSNSNLIDLTDVNFADVATSKTTYTDHGDGTGTLTLYNANGQQLDSLGFVGQYQLANFTIQDDGAGHTLIVDPPVVNNLACGQSVGASVANDPGHPSSTIAATTQNQTLIGSASSDNFVFNFAEVGHATVTDFHPELDTLQFKTAVFASAQAALNATHDDGHGNSIITVDAHDTITLNGVLKAQLHANDFHVV